MIDRYYHVLFLKHRFYVVRTDRSSELCRKLAQISAISDSFVCHHFMFTGSDDTVHLWEKIVVQYLVDTAQTEPVALQYRGNWILLRDWRVLFEQAGIRRTSN